MYEIVNYVDCSREQQLEILALRNHDDVRKWMVTPDIIPQEAHLRFVESLKGNPNRIYYAIYRSGFLVGTYNLTKEADGVWERGIIANPLVQGKGETIQWEREILAGLPEKGIYAVTAKVKQDNLRSVRYHEKLGFKEQSRSDNYIHYLLRLK